MAVKSDKWIRRMALEHGIIDPFLERQVRDGVISYGLSSYGYDVRIAHEFKIFTNINHMVVDPKVTFMEHNKEYSKTGIGLVG